MGDSRTSVATRAALALVAHLLPPPHRVGDARLFAAGRVHLWPGWSSLRGADRERVCAFLGRRPDALADDSVLREEVAHVLESGDDFAVDVSGTDSEADHIWGRTFSVVPGRPVVERLDAWLAALARAGRTSPRPWVDRPAAGEASLVAGDLRFRIPVRHLPVEPPPPSTLNDGPPADRIAMAPEALRELARRLDAAQSGPRYEQVAVDRFLLRLLDQHGERVNHFEADATSLLVAPTGTGKSVFARLLAIALARSGHPVALVVPDIPMVWREAQRLESAVNAIGERLKIVPLSSWRSKARHLAQHLERPDSTLSEDEWVLRNAGYTCMLAAYSELEEEAPKPGDEPCTRLRQRGSDGKDRPVACPFSTQCGRFAAFERARTADIVVLNHHSFLAGRVPMPVVLRDGTERAISTAELILRRCSVVLVDEIDVLQQVVVGANSRGLVLSSHGGLSLPYRLITEVDGRRAQRRLNPELRFERGRSALLRIIHEAEGLVELMNRDELEWPERGKMTWLESMDGWIASRLFSDEEDGIERVRRLYEREPFASGSLAETIRQILTPLAGPGLGDGRSIQEVRTELMLALRTRQAGENRQQAERNKLVDRLVIRAALLQLDLALRHLRPQLPGLEEMDIVEAARARDALLGFAPWSHSPTGALGQRLFGYTFSRRPGEPGVLESRVLSGDPHALIAELGGIVARGLASVPRIVIGLSATARFRGSPSSDVLASVAAYVRDEARNVFVIGAAVTTRISGVMSRGDRMAAAREAAGELWQAMLADYLQRLAVNESTRGRARALVVTASYDEAEAVAAGLRHAIGSTGSARIRRIVSSDEDVRRDPDALPRARIETFGSVEGPAILVGPLSVVARSHNILQPGTELSALSGIFVLTRPVPPTHDAERFLSHVAYNALLSPPTWTGSASDTLRAERSQAWHRLRALQRSPATFRRMRTDLRRELVCDVLVELAQLAGRARRGGTPVDLVFVDAAFADQIAPWKELVKDVLDWWRELGWLDEMVRLHGALVYGLAEYSEFSIATNWRV